MKIREIASGLQFPEGPVAMPDGSVLVVEIARGTLTRVLADGRLQVVAETGGGPNGAALAPDDTVVVCNNGGFRWTTDPGGIHRPIGQADDYSGGRIERINLDTGSVERMYERCGERPLRGPNDLIFDDAGGFYFTDLGKAREQDLDWGAIYYARADGSAIEAVVPRAMTPNGTALSPDGRTLYYAETEGARLWAFDVLAAGKLRRPDWPPPHGGRLVTASPGANLQRFDSIAVDAFGNVLVATLLHGGITVVSPDGRLASHIPLPDPFTTNCCFGGHDLRTLYVTLSGTGKLIAIDDWPVPGLRLVHG